MIDVSMITMNCARAIMASAVQRRGLGCIWRGSGLVESVVRRHPASRGAPGGGGWRATGQRVDPAGDLAADLADDRGAQGDLTAPYVRHRHLLALVQADAARRLADARAEDHARRLAALA
jgi:hypothetical protein